MEPALVSTWRLELRELRILLIFFLSYLVLEAAAGSNAALSPRLIVATKENETLLLLPESHIGLPDQYDSYFDHVILPAYRASSRLLVERSEDAQLSERLRFRRCDNESPTEKRFDDVIDAELPGLVPESVWRILPPSFPLEKLGRFMKTELLLQYLYFNRYARSNDKLTSAQMRQIAAGATTGYANRLMLDTPRPYSSVDSPDSMFEVYCSLSPAERNDMVDALIRKKSELGQVLQRSGAVDVRVELDRLDEAYRAALRATRLAVSGRQTSSDLVENDKRIDRFILAGRTRQWAHDLPRLIGKERLPFFVIGAAHFPDATSGQGLISLLRENGYRIDVVENARQLSGILKSIPPALSVASSIHPDAGVPEHLPGMCISVGRTRSCSWGSKRMLLDVTRTSSTDDALILCVERDTEWGASHRCTKFHIAPSLLSLD